MPKEEKDIPERVQRVSVITGTPEHLKAASPVKEEKESRHIPQKSDLAVWSLKIAPKKTFGRGMSLKDSIKMDNMRNMLKKMVMIQIGMNNR